MLQAGASRYSRIRNGGVKPGEKPNTAACQGEVSATPYVLGSVDEVPHPKTEGCNEYEADVAVGGLVVSSGQSAAVLEL